MHGPRRSRSGRDVPDPVAPASREGLTPTPTPAPRTDRPVEAGDSALPAGERAELQRQGAKAAARGELAAGNPLQRPENSPPATGESQQTWSQRSTAWQQGHAAQSRASQGAGASSAEEADQER